MNFPSGIEIARELTGGRHQSVWKPMLPWTRRHYPQFLRFSREGKFLIPTLRRKYSFRWNICASLCSTEPWPLLQYRYVYIVFCFINIEQRVSYFSDEWLQSVKHKTTLRPASLPCQFRPSIQPDRSSQGLASNDRLTSAPHEGRQGSGSSPSHKPVHITVL